MKIISFSNLQNFGVKKNIWLQKVTQKNDETYIIQ